jgi:protocatechuate 3,4-dioxygenase beta subunit
LPLDTDNDLVVLNDRVTPAVGEITWLSGKLLTKAGSPIRNATIEIWQCDATGVYLHSKTGGDKAKRDVNFQCFGRFVTGVDGRVCVSDDQAGGVSRGACRTSISR